MLLFSRLLLLSLLLCIGLARAEAPAPPPEKLLKALARGVNLSIWYTYRDEPGIDPAYWYPAGSDWRELKRLGMSHVRVQFEPEYFRDERLPGALRADRMAALRRDLSAAAASGLVVVLAADPATAEKARLVKDDAGIAELASFWTAFAKSLKTIGPNRLVFELLNEPGTADAAANRALMQRLAEAVRHAAPKHTLVVEGHGYADIDSLLALEPLPLANLVYSFHFYEPPNFTHQGTTWSWPMFTKLKGLPYPGSPEAVLPALQAADDEAKPIVEDYGKQRWDRARIEARLKLVHDWREARGVAVWCGEFGTAKLGAPEDSRHRWLADARLSLDAQGIPWALFDYVGHFGLFTGNSGERVLDASAAEALGLNAPPARPKDAQAGR